MRRALAAILALLSVPALAAIETTTITGTVYAPDGSVATGGSITCALTPTPGRASDGANLQVVASRYVATISGSGTVSFTLVPNDVISPAGTVYACTYTITGPLRSTFTESWYVTTSPDPVSIGAINRVGGPTLTLPTITGAANSMMATDGSGGLVSTPALQRAASGNAVKFAGRYDETDSQGDSTIDARRCADYDGDGTLEIADVKSCVETNQANGMTFIISAGTYTGGFKTTVNITADNVVVRGMGDATKLVINATCSGSVDSVSDNDGTAENSNLFLVASGADNFTLSDMYIDGGSSRFAAQIIDTNADGSPDCAINSNASTTSCTVGAATWCPADWHDILATAGAVAGITLERLHVVNADRRVAQVIAGVGSTVRIRQNWFDGTGEHQMSINGDSVSITDNDLLNSSAFANAGLQLGPSSNNYAWTITGNRFRKWIGPAIGSEDLNQGSATVMSNVTVTGNAFYNDYTLTTSLAAGAAIDLNTGGEANYTIRQWNISGNTFEAVENSDTSGAIIVRSQSGATQGGKVVIGNNIVKHDFQASASAKAVITAAVPYTLITGNLVDFDGDDTSGGTTPETGIMMNGNCNSCAAIGNFIVATGTGANAIAADSATQATIQSNHIDYTGITGGTNFAILLTNTSTDATVKSNVLNCAASDTSTSMVRIQNTTDNFVVNDNLMIEGANQVNVANALVGTVQNNRARGLSSYQVSRQAGQSHWESGNICFSCYQANGSNVDPDSIVANGETFIVDANGDGTFDATTYHVIYGDTQLRFPGQTDDAFEAYLTAREATADRTSTLSNATGQVPVFSSSTSVGILVWSAGTDTTLDTGNLVCADRDLVCIDVYTPAGDTTNTCASDFGSGVPFYAVCRGN